MTLNPQQEAALEKLAAWYENARDTRDDFTFTADVFPLFGYAGTGKTFTAARIAERLGITNVVFGTFTGKAASVLRKSLDRYGADFPVTTIHSAIYFPTTSAEAREALRVARNHLAQLQDVKAALDLMPEGDARRLAYVVEHGWADLKEFAGELSEVSESIPELEANSRRLRFEFNPDGPWADADLIVLDEASMVNAKIAADIESYGVPIVVLGDPAQLPPVEGGGYYTNREPAVLLTHVMRQEGEDNQVLELATRVRESQSTDLGLTKADFRRRNLDEAMAADIILVWTNRRRWGMTNAIRKRLGRPVGEVVAGDQVMILTNNKDMAIFNGQIFDVTKVVTGNVLGPTLHVREDMGRGVFGPEHTIPVYAEGFRGMTEQAQAKNAGLGRSGGRALATFAQVITVHKAQGSEWPHVYVLDETPGMISMTAKKEGFSAGLLAGRQWLYTAATRASEKVTIVDPT